MMDSIAAWWMCSSITLLAPVSLVVGLYQAYKAKRVADRDEWYKVHKIMPYAGPDVGFFIGGFSAVLCAVGASFITLITYLLQS